MKLLLLLPLLLMPLSRGQDPAVAGDNSPVVVLSFRWFKDRQAAENASSIAPAPAMIAANKNFEKQRRVNALPGERDPNADTLDGRSAALDKIVQESREAPPVNGFAYEVKIQNTTTKPVQKVFWEYQFRETANPTNVTRRRFVCGAKIGPEKQKSLQVFSLLGPSDVIDVKSLAKKSGSQFEERVVIDRVEYTDGSFWQRTDWDFDVTRLVSKGSRNVPACRSF